jgi:dihydrophenazinedicarboxylate synthase
MNPSPAPSASPPEYETPPPESLGLVRRWTAKAVERGVREPRAMALATATPDGRASNRMWP